MPSLNKTHFLCSFKHKICSKMLLQYQHKNKQIAKKQTKHSEKCEMYIGSDELWKCISLQVNERMIYHLFHHLHTMVLPISQDVLVQLSEREPEHLQLCSRKIQVQLQSREQRAVTVFHLEEQTTLFCQGCPMFTLEAGGSPWRWSYRLKALSLIYRGERW